eukprot:jgi/Psemu1/22471/gm1.22471_g
MYRRTFKIDMNYMDDDDRNLLWFKQMYEKHGWDTMSPSQTSTGPGPGPMTQAAAFGFLGMVSNNSGAELTYSLQSDDDNTYDETPVIELAPDTQTKRPASKSATTTTTNININNNNNNNRTRSTPQMFTKKELMNDNLTEGYLFHKTVSRKPNKQSKSIVDQALKIWTTHLTNLQNGKLLDFKMHQGVKYSYYSSKHKGIYVAVVNTDRKDNKIEDPTLGTKRNKAKFDEFADEKFKKVIDDGTYKPFEDSYDLLQIMAMELGWQFGIRGRDELVYLKCDYLKLGVFAYGAMKDLKYTIIAPSGGFCKTNGLSINNLIENKQHPMVVEDPENPNLRSFCHVNNNKKKTANIYFKLKSPVSTGIIQKWVREFAQGADFKDWEKECIPHDNPHQCCTILTSDANVLKKV